jgi:hypothetical protein
MMSSQFFLEFLTTVVLVRAILYLYPIPSPTIGGYRLHHYMYGLIGIPLSVVTHSLLLFAVSFGLLVDELTYLAIGGKTHADNYSLVSLIGTSILCILVFIFRAPVTELFLALSSGQLL